ncbi:MAG: hypothetical protein OEY14_05865 [Myxococcales bacterium]|nr:hypothetical protein [Myxococcales bacterium]
MPERDDSPSDENETERAPGEPPAIEALEPARYEDPEAASPYGPRLPWARILGVLGVILVMLVGYQLRAYSRQSALREGIHAYYDAEVEPSARRVRELRRQLEDWMMEAAQTRPESWIRPGLKVSDLHELQGIYLRIPNRAAGSRSEIDLAAQRMGGDAITRCLGIGPASLRGLYARGQFLMPGWIDQVDEAEDVLRLRVLDEDLRRRNERDLPLMMGLLEADYFMLVLEQGQSREEPVHVFLWDLETGDSILRTRVQASGMLLPVRIALDGAPRAPHVEPGAHANGAMDCSIAAHIKALSGEAPLTMRSALPVAPPEAEEPTGSAQRIDAVAPAPATGAGPSSVQDEAAPSSPPSRP